MFIHDEFQGLRRGNGAFQVLKSAEAFFCASNLSCKTDSLSFSIYVRILTFDLFIFLNYLRTETHTDLPFLYFCKILVCQSLACLGYIVRWADWGCNIGWWWPSWFYWRQLHKAPYRGILPYFGMLIIYCLYITYLVPISMLPSKQFINLLLHRCLNRCPAHC
jgi:hypothetical protein